MLFQTWSFVLFFLIVYPIYLVLKGTRFRLLWLLIISYFFYGCFHPLYPVLIVYSSFVDYAVVLRMGKSRWRKAWLFVSIFNNLALLGFFTYGTFITGNLNVLLSLLGVHYVIAPPGILLPVGLSFYTFQSM